MTLHSEAVPNAASTADALDQKTNQIFAGKVVRKDLVRKVKVGANVPVFVLEYLLGKYCASDDPMAIDLGLQAVEKTLRENYVRPDESNKAQSWVRERGSYRFIDKIKVNYHSSEDKYWAELTNFGHAHVHVPESYVTVYDRLLLGGIWAQIEIRHMYDETAGGKKSPFWVEDLKPIQLASFSFDEYVEGRSQFTTDEWIDLLVRTVGLEPSEFDRRHKLLFLSRMIPLCERNYNFVELGPRGTGKSYVYQEISPYSILLTGATTVARLFYNIGRREVGLVGKWDSVAFDEVADLDKMDKEVVTTLKTYCESGRFARDRETIEGHASLAMFGNTNQPIDVMVGARMSLFSPMPAVIRDDMAFLDRMHFYLPGWEMPKMRNEFLTDHYGFVVDYVAEAFRYLRQANYTERVDRHFDFGSHLNTRDVKAVRKTVSGLLKMLHPSGECTREEMQEYVELAMEARRRVKEQLKKLPGGGVEYAQTSFSYIDLESRDEHFVGVPEEGGRELVSLDPLAPGSVYAATIGSQGRVGLYRIEVGGSVGTGKLALSGGVTTETRESVKRAFDYMKAHKVELGIGATLDTTDFHVELVDLLNAKYGSEIGVAFFTAVLSYLQKRSTLAGLVILGDMSIHGNPKPVTSLVEPLQLAKDNGAKRALIPIENKRHFLEVDADIVEHVDPIFYSDPMVAARKALGV